MSERGPPHRHPGRGRVCGTGRAHVSDGLIAEATTWGEALKVALGAEGGSILLEEAAASQGHGAATANEVLRVPSAAQRSHHLRVEGEAWVRVSCHAPEELIFIWHISSFLFYHLTPFTHFSPPTLRD